ncbi:acyltransferase family protein [Rhodococcus koreensis]|uniref:acyltransferase family protein n=1 Tax=Rhodococcus koreensis TaxID=99653 RepID=UPI00366CF503
MTQAGRRSAAVDAVRIVGVVAVVVGHTWEAEMFQRLIYSWQVPVFFVLTGYFWTAQRPLGMEVRKRSLTLLRPYAFWLGVVGALFLGRSVLESGMSRLPSDVWHMVLGGSYAVRPFTAFWFATALFFGVLALRSLQRFPMWVQWSVAGVALAVAYVIPGFVNSIPLSAGTGVACLVFMVAGVAFRSVRDRIPSTPALGAVFVTAGLTLAGLDVTDSLSLKNANFGTVIASPLVAISISVGLVLVAEWAVPMLSDRVQDVITTVALGGWMVVLTHPVILWALSTPPTGSWVACALCIAVPWIAAMVLLRTPLAPLALGVPTRTPARLAHEGLAGQPGGPTLAAG